MDIGETHIYETVKYCDLCKAVYESEELKDVVPDSAKFGFDVMVHVGFALFLEHRSDKEIWKELKHRNIHMSLREIGNLGRDFIVYLALAHKEIQPIIKGRFEMEGGYIPHFDSTMEGDSPNILSALDEISNIVLGNVKVSSESAEQIIPFMEKIKKAYGVPLAVVTDMAAAFAKAIKTVFGGVLHLICHFHFLRDSGKDLFGYENMIIKDELSRYTTRTSLRELCKNLKKMIDQDSQLTKELNTYLNQQKAGRIVRTPSILITLYTLIVWILDYKSESRGYGFPFDHPYLDCYHRLEKSREVIKELPDSVQENHYAQRLQGILDFILGDSACRKIVRRMEKKVIHFNKLRDALRIALPDGDKGLNDDGEDADMKTIEKEVEKFINSEEIEELTAINDDYRKMVKQIKKYWKKLFADAIEIKRKDGTSYFILPQRTNNILERFFRDLKKWCRQKRGGKKLGKQLTAILAETPLVQNLQNEEYLKILLNGKENLALRFAEIERKLVIEERRKNKNRADKHPPVLKKLLKLPSLPERISKAALLQAG